MNSINGLDGQGLGIAPRQSPRGAKQDGFKAYMKEALASVNTSQVNADKAVEQNLEGKTGIQEAMLALQEADISMRLFLQVRNKVLDAYREIMRMPF